MRNRREGATERHGHAEDVELHLRGIGHDATPEDIRGPRDIGEPGRHQAARDRLGHRQGQAPLPEQVEHDRLHRLLVATEHVLADERQQQRLLGIEDRLRRRIVVGVGGTSTTDGGRGCVEALGAVPPQVQLVAATDVASPLLGPAGAARGFGTQKGADDAMVERMEERLRIWAADSAGDPEAPGAGAGGGLGFGLSLLGAARVSGAGLVADIVGLSDRIAEADVVVTGEGSVDWSSLRGKVVAEVARRAVEHGRPCIVLAGQASVGSREAAAAGIDEVHSVAGGAGSAAASLADPVGHLSRLAERVAR